MTWVDALILAGSSCVLGYFVVVLFPSFLEALGSTGRSARLGVRRVMHRRGDKSGRRHRVEAGLI